MNESTGDPNVLKFLALGRLAKGSSGGAIAAREAELGALAASETKKTLGKHQVLAYASASKDERTKKYKQHVKELMSKGAARLTGGKRVRLLSDDTEEGDKYELNVLTEYIDGDPNLALVFFAITAVDFGKYQSISGLFREFKAGVYSQFESSSLATAQSSGPVHATMKRFFESLFSRFNKNVLLSVSHKVEEVKEVMKDNVQKALTNVEQLEEMEIKAESMERQAKLFERRSGSVLWLMRCRCIKITLLLALLVLALLALLIFYIWSKTHTSDSSSSDTPTPTPSTSTGASG